MADLERRSIGSTPRTMRGRAIVYDSLSDDLGGFRERFRPGSVRLAPDLVILSSHNPSTVLGRTAAGTAWAYDDGAGIVFEVSPPDTQWARDLGVSMERGDIQTCSFAFRVPPGGDDFYYDHTRNGVIRDVFEAEVSELSIVAMPAYPATQAAVQ